MSARIADEYKLGSYVIVAVGTAGHRLNDEGYATLSVRVLKLSRPTVVSGRPNL